jgi:uncharacterized protein (TIGR03663 family)
MAAMAIDRERAAYVVLVFVGFLLRIWDVGARVVHHDESLHAYYSWNLIAGHGYAYDPLMHGPLQFEVVPVFYLLFGVSDFSARLLAVFLGTALIALPYFLRRYLTAPGALLAALGLAISPSFLYYSRFIRDDIYLACFTLLLFIAIIKYLERPRTYWLYIGAAAMALAMATMEAAYINFAILATFLVFEGIRERVTGDGPVLRAVRATSVDTWLTGLAIFVVITVLLYSTFFTNPFGVWDTQHSLLSPDRRDILGGLTYWQSQQHVQRGSEPWYYYILTLSLYEQIAVLFGLAGIILCMARRSLFRTYLVWWAVMSFALYSWAGEKMPWLTIHIALPLILLAGLFLGWVWSLRALLPRAATASAFLVLLLVQIHSAFALNYVDGANPTEMLIYVQTAQDVKNVSDAIQRMPNWPNVTVGLDDTDVGGWPFVWYLRDDPRVTEASAFNGPTCGGSYCQVLLMLQPTYDKYGSALTSRYVVQQYRWNWWFPEDYMTWFPQHWGAFLSGSGQISDLLGTSRDWHNIWNWMVYRTPFGPRDARLLYVLVRRDLVPGAKYYKTPGGIASPSPTTPAQTVRSLPYALAGHVSGGTVPLYGPRGVASDSSGNLYVADPLNHRIVVYRSDGTFLRAWGSAGTGAGQFAARDSPQGVAVGPNGKVYVTDTWNQRIEVFSKGGRFLRQWGGGPIGTGPGQFYGPRSVAVSPSGRVYVADTGNERIQIFSSSGKYISAFGSRGTAQGQFDEPSSVAVGARGTVYVADFWNQRIQVFSPSGAYVRSFPVTDWTPQSYDEPYIAVDMHTGQILASDPSKHQILVFSESGHTVGAIGSTNLTMPIGLAILPGSRVAVGDPDANKVDIFAPQTEAAKGSPSRSSKRG